MRTDNSGRSDYYSKGYFSKGSKAVAGTPTLTSVDARALAGTWNTADPATRGLVRIDIAAAGTEITVHAFGACSPTPCDWGTVSGRAYAPSISATNAIAFSASYKFNFVETIITGAVENGVLIAETFNHFTDNSGRSDYYSKGYLSKGTA